SAPPPPAAPATPPTKGAAKPGEADEASADFAALDLDGVTARGRGRTERRFRLGLRRGENEIVVKVVFAGGAGAEGRRGPIFAMGSPVLAGPGGGASFTFTLTPEGDDVLTHEVATALRQEALEQTRPSPPVPAAPVDRTKVPSATKPEVKKEEPKKVSLVGE